MNSVPSWLGDQARRAVETLLRASSVPSDLVCKADLPWLYQAAVRVVLRLVVLMFAEGRGLLPVGNRIYAESYSIAGLRKVLSRRRPGRRFAWARICALCRLVFQGSPHPSLPVPAYGGELFQPAEPGNADGLPKCLALLEDPLEGPDDVAAGTILDLLINRTQGRRSVLDYAQLSTEVIGALYQGLLDYRLRPNPWRLELNRLARKESGAFYTPARLAAATARHTLLPLTRDPHGKPLPPEEILKLKVCDPAMGSGTFLVAALNVLSQALAESLSVHNRLRPAGANGISTIVDLGKKPPFELPHGPGHPSFDTLLLAHLKRHVVEECLYGVDVDPLAVELARIAMWLETMDRRLPFTFLDHKLKCGNSLVGGKLDDLSIYPLLAWRRESKNATQVAFQATRTRASSQLDQVARQLTSPLLPLPGAKSGFEALRQLARVFRDIHSLPVQFPDRKRELYEREFLRSNSVLALRRALDSWCALWFWPDDQLETAPMPLDFLTQLPAPKQIEMVEKISGDMRFFHWELEFPDVFDRGRPGFDAMLGNPPWDVLKAGTESSTQQTTTRRRDLANWFSSLSTPAGRLDGLLRYRLSGSRRQRTSAQPRPFALQGGAEYNSYKLFLEQAMALCRKGGRLGLILPSGIYSDKGAGALRGHLLSQWRWEWLFGFENRRRIFPVDGRVKFAVVVAEKGTSGGPPRTAFMRHNIADWEEPEAHAFHYPAVLLSASKEPSAPFVELTGPRELEILSGLWLGREEEFDKRQERGLGPLNTLAPWGRSKNRSRGWRLKYTRELDAGDPDHRFRCPAELCQAGLHPSELGWWEDPAAAGVPVAFPVFQGVTIKQFEFSTVEWIEERGKRGRWVEQREHPPRIKPRFLLPAADWAGVRKPPGLFKIGVRRIARNTDTRTVTAALLPNMPCTDKLSIISTPSPIMTLALVAVLNSFCVDYAARLICSGTNLDRHHLLRLPLPSPDATPILELALISLRLNGVHPVFAPLWLLLAAQMPFLKKAAWSDWWTLDIAPRTRMAAIADALVARSFNLSYADFAHILRDCDHPPEKLNDPTFVSSLDPRGFWRVDKHRAPSERRSVLALNFLAQLERGDKSCLDELLLPTDQSGLPRLDWATASRFAKSVSSVLPHSSRSTRRLL